VVESGPVPHRGYTRRELDSCLVSVGEVSLSVGQKREALFLKYAYTFTTQSETRQSLGFYSCLHLGRFLRSQHCFPKAQSFCSKEPISLPDGRCCMDNVTFYRGTIARFSQSPELVSRGVSSMG